MKTYSNSEKGFTLVELAVVMIIIGLLIGGVLKGQELIKSARVTSTISQVKAIDAATSTFQDIYAGLPGDLLNADTRLPGCIGDCVPTAPDGDGIVDATAVFTDAAGEELQAFFPQIGAADLMSGIVQGTATFGGDYPQTPVGGGLIASTVQNAGQLPGGLDTDTIGFRSGLYIMHLTNLTDLTAGAATPLTMQRIDRKIDDGNPFTGSVLAGAAAGQDCATPGADPLVDPALNAYDTTQSTLACNALIRIQN
jgi:prepilin-type N-terminal cleavage/methylation domain-containing protein